MKKSLRFEIFARDGFICQYCGSRPPDCVLEVDHIHPVSRGGTDDSINLVTSCYECNRGKRAKVLSQIAPRPDADMALLQIQQELAEAKRFMKAKKQRDKYMTEVCGALRESWSKYLTEDPLPSDATLVPWIRRYGAEEVDQAISIASRAYMKRQFGYYASSAFKNLLPYIGGILRKRDEEGQKESIN